MIKNIKPLFGNCFWENFGKIEECQYRSKQKDKKA